MLKFTPEQEQKLFNILLSHKEIGIAITDNKGEWLWINEAFQDFLGYTYPELKRAKWQDITSNEDRNFDVENALMTKDGLISGYGMHKKYIQKNNGPVVGRLRVFRINDKYENSKSGEFLFFLVTFVPLKQSLSPTISEDMPNPFKKFMFFLKRNYGIIAAITLWLSTILAMAYEKWHNVFNIGE